MVLLHDHIAIAIHNIFAGYSSCDSVLQSLDGFLAVHEGADFHSGDLRKGLSFAAVHFANDQFLRHVNHSSGQITGVCGTQSGIGHTFSCTMCGHEVFQYVQTFTEV